jgi:hypothetical protein
MPGINNSPESNSKLCTSISKLAQGLCCLLPIVHKELLMLQLNEGSRISNVSGLLSESNSTGSGKSTVTDHGRQ